MKIVTWNVNSVTPRKERLLAFLAREAPDVICIQELKCVDEKFPLAEITAAGYHATVYGQKTYNGVAILSREAPIEVERGMGDGAADDAARLVTARFASGLSVVCAYVPNGQEVGSDKYRYKLGWLERCRAYLDRRFSPKDRLVVVGDFNVAPRDLDVHDPDAWYEKILCSTSERMGLAKLIDFGLVDTFASLYPGKQAFTWWDYRMLGFPKNHGLRIDLILATEPMVTKLSEVRVDRDERKGEKPSDHAPVIASF